MAKVLKSTLVAFLVTWAVSFAFAYLVISGFVFESMPVAAATGVSLGMASFVGLLRLPCWRSAS
jgi:hypothetical protein